MDQELETRLKGLITSNRIVIFMKGNKMFPQCGFSAQVIGALKELGVDFDAHNILADMEVRQGLKELSNWPTYPQLYVDGELIGGCDIIMQMYESGELARVLGASADAAGSN